MNPPHKAWFNYTRLQIVCAIGRLHPGNRSLQPEVLHPAFRPLTFNRAGGDEMMHFEQHPA